MSKKQKRTLSRILFSAALLAAAALLPLNGWARLAVFLLPYAVIGWDVLWRAVRNIARGQVFDENFLMALATVGAFCVGEYPEAVFVMLFYQVGELFQSYAVAQSRKSIASLMDIRPDYANIEQDGALIQVAPEEVAEVMADLIREGKITHWGISEANEDYLRRAHKVCPVTAVQNRYSMMARQYESLFPALEELGIGFVAFSPMANGFLTGQYGKGAAFDPRYDYRSSMPQFTDQAVDQNQALLTLLTTLAQEKGATPAQISLAWMLGKKPWIVPIPGTRKEARMAENAGAAQVALTPQEVAALDQALDAMSMSPVFGGTDLSAHAKEGDQ